MRITAITSTTTPLSLSLSLFLSFSLPLSLYLLIYRLHRPVPGAGKDLASVLDSLTDSPPAQSKTSGLGAVKKPMLERARSAVPYACSDFVQ